jgi:hypothetical protein
VWAAAPGCCTSIQKRPWAAVEAGLRAA